MVKNYFLILILIPFLSTGCYHENVSKIEIPEVLLSADQMVLVMTDVHLVEGALNYHRVKRLEYKDYKSAYYSKILQEHGINAVQLRENIDYYNSNPKQMEDIYERVLSNLVKLETEMKIEQQKSDTLDPKDS